MEERRYTFEEYAEVGDRLARIYIVGPISIFPYEKARKRFDKAQERLNSAGFYIVANPLSFCCRSWDYGRCMRACMNRLSKCDAIYIQKWWWISRGARLERRVAIACDLDIIYE